MPSQIKSFGCGRALGASSNTELPLVVVHYGDPIGVAAISDPMTRVIHGSKVLPVAFSIALANQDRSSGAFIRARMPLGPV